MLEYLNSFRQGVNIPLNLEVMFSEYGPCSPEIQMLNMKWNYHLGAVEIGSSVKFWKYALFLGTCCMNFVQFNKWFGNKLLEERMNETKLNPSYPRIELPVFEIVMPPFKEFSSKFELSEDMYIFHENTSQPIIVYLYLTQEDLNELKRWDIQFELF